MFRMTAGPDDPEEGKKRGSRRNGKKRGKPEKRARKDKGSGRSKGQRRAASPDGAQREAMIRAIGHPLRRRVLRVLLDEGKPLSPAQIREILGMSLNAVSYQVRVLRRLGALKPAGSQQVRGALEHFYLPAIKGDVPIETLLEETREWDEKGE